MDFINREPGRYRLVLDRRRGCNGHPTFWNGIMLFVRG